MKILVINDSRDCGRSYKSPFLDLGECVDEDDDLWAGRDSDIGLVVFTGGADVSPHIYHEEVNSKTHTSPRRDIIEARLFHNALKLKLPIVGICRGAQFICAMSGGKLIQHVNGHHDYHEIRTVDGRCITVSSIHHQMQYPPKDAKVLAWADPACSDVYEGGHEDLVPEVEAEVVYYPRLNSLGFQYHPEIMSPKSEGFQYCQDLTKTLLNRKLI
jgi:gamma-glutamyl-gamma-aminobutyrate hydrolase PuuD